MEAGVVGLAGGLLGLALTALGLAGVRLIFSPSTGRLTHLSPMDIGIALILAVLATTVGGALSHVARGSCSARLATKSSMRVSPWK